MATPIARPTNDAFFEQAYEELRRAARRLNGQNRHATLNPTAIVHEVYLRLAESDRFQACSAEHLKYTVVQAMRYILVDAARRKSAARRGGGNLPARLGGLANNAASVAPYDPTHLLDLDCALRTLQRDNELQARVFELQFFGGLELAEIAALTGASEKKVQRALRLARAYLADALGRTESK